MKDVLYEVRCLKSNEDMILALTGQFKQLSHEPGIPEVMGSNPVESPEFFRFMRQLLKLNLMGSWCGRISNLVLRVISLFRLQEPGIHENLDSY